MHKITKTLALSWFVTHDIIQNAFIYTQDLHLFCKHLCHWVVNDENAKLWCDLGESVGSRTCYIFGFLFDWSPQSLGEVHFAENPTWIGPVVWFQSYSNWKILKTTENKRNTSLFLAVSHNQCTRLPTDPARSQHIVDKILSWIVVQEYQI